jgi:GNAT superfamily N-acetyltransferase
VERSRGIELQRRSLAAFVRLLASGSGGAALFERDGVVGSIVPACPERSVVNSVTYRDARSLEAALPELTAAHDQAGIRAWTVWVPEEDRRAAALLEASGHRLDSTPAAMVLQLPGLPDPEPGDLDWDANAEPADVGRVNDLAYGLPAPAFAEAIAGLPQAEPLRLYQARVDGRLACVLGTLDDGEDCGVYFVATLTEHRGRRLAGRLLHVALAEARDRGLRTSSLQSTKLGYPVYERLGYEPIFTIEMWERRR